jgi:uncharacterized protein (DUF2147 family)
MRRNSPKGLQNLIDDWANFSYYSTFLLCGFVLARFPALEAVAHGERKRALSIAFAATVLLLLAVLGVFASPTVILTLTAVAGWCFVLAFLGFARQRLSYSRPALDYLTESALPVYLLHQSAIVVPGYFLIQLPLGPLTKFTLLLAVSTTATLGVYHLLVRPFAIPRFLCGMKARDPHPRARLAVGLTTAAMMLMAVAVFGPAASTEAAHESPLSPLGRWYAEGGAAQVEITDCGERLCGRIVWLRSPFDEYGCELRDRYNPDESLRDRSVSGLQILGGLARISTNAPVWKGGTIYDPGSGNTYRASLTVLDENRLELRGYIGIPLIGRTARWFRVGAEQAACSEIG